jgi:photosystem II stability/assembly factor-like uncharacterized protein
MSVDPNNADVVYVGLDCGGMHVTLDGGEKWENINKGIVGNLYHVDWNNHYGVLVLTTGRVLTTTYTGEIYLSDNQGQQWEKVFEAPGGVGFMLQSPHDAGTVFTAGGRGVWERGRRLREMSETTPDGPWAGSIQVSRKFGEKGSWSKLNTDPKNNIPSRAYIFTIAIDRQDKNLMYAATDYGMFRSRDGGVSWESVQKGLGKARGLMLLTVPGKKGTVYVTMGEPLDPKAVLGSVYRSTDAGETWQSISEGLPKENNFTSITADGKNPNVLYVGSWDWGGALYRSIDGGDHWQLAFNDSSFAKFSHRARQDNRVWHSSGLHVSVGGAISSGGDDKNKDGICDTIYFLGDNVGVIWKSLDGGQNWQQIVSRRKTIDGRDYYSGRGEIEFLCARRVLVDPQDPRHLWVSYFDWGLFESVDGGKSFASSFGPWMEGELIGATKGVVMDVDDSKILYCAGGGAVFTNSGGQGWWMMAGGQRERGGLPKIAEELYIAKWKEGNKLYKYLYAAGGEKAVYRLDLIHGGQWEKVNEGLEDIKPQTMGMGPIVGMPNTSILYLTTEKGIYRSDNGKMWKRLTGPGTRYEVVAGFVPGIVIDPRNPKRIFVTKMGPFQRHPDEGVYLSEDGGDSWKKIAQVPIPFELAIDSSALATKLYVATAIEGVFKVEKKANSDAWTTEVAANRDNGLDTTRCWSVTVDPHHRQRIYIATHGTGVFTGEVDK